MEEPVAEANPEISHEDEDVPSLVREDVGAGCRWTLPSDGAAIGRAARIVTGFAAVLFLGGVGVLFCAPVLDSDTMVRMLSTAWIVGIILALAAAHWRTIAGLPLVLDVQPDTVQLHNPAYLWGRTKTWHVQSLRKFVIASRGKAITTGRPVGNLYLFTRLRSCLLFHGLETTELEEVAERIRAITGVPVAK